MPTQTITICHMNKEATGRLLLHLRKGRELELEDVDDATGVSASHISRLERGLVPNPRWGDLERLAEFYGLKVWELAQPGIGELAPFDIDPEIRMGALILQDGLRDKTEAHQRALRAAYLSFVQSLGANAAKRDSDPN